MSPRQLRPPGWANPVGYAHGMSAEGRVVVTAGQVGWNPATGEFESDDFAEQTARALQNVVALLEQDGAVAGARAAYGAAARMDAWLPGLAENLRALDGEAVVPASSEASPAASAPPAAPAAKMRTDQGGSVPPWGTAGSPRASRC